MRRIEQIRIARRPAGWEIRRPVAAGRIGGNAGGGKTAYAIEPGIHGVAGRAVGRMPVNPNTAEGSAMAAAGTANAAQQEYWNDVAGPRWVGLDQESSNPPLSP